MPVMQIDVPAIIIESHQQEDESLQEGIERGLVIWEYLNGRLSLRECGELLHIGYRGFIELLWSKGIPIDGLSAEEFTQQLATLRAAFDQA
jgi:predicted HTH domain antitoxin